MKPGAEKLVPESVLAAARVHLGRDFLARLERHVARLRLLGSRLDSIGAFQARRKGLEFLGHRPYQAGEDARDLDWSLLARLDQPFVRVLRGQGRPLLWMALDGSRSMGVGRPSKLQAAAELATALGFAAVSGGGVAQLVAPQNGARSITRTTLGAPRDLGPWTQALESLDLARTPPSWSSVQLLEAPAASAAQVVFLSDLMDADPDATALALRRIAGRSGEVCVVQILAREEWDPRSLSSAGHAAASAWSWLDLETREVCAHDGSPSRLEAYVRLLARHRAAFEAALARVGGRFFSHSSDSDFERTACRMTSSLP